MEAGKDEVWESWCCGNFGCFSFASDDEEEDSNKEDIHLVQSLVLEECCLLNGRDGMVVVAVGATRVTSLGSLLLFQSRPQ